MRAAALTTELRLGGMVPLSGCDWPGELVASVFCQGCPWRCSYCHNPHLLDAGRPGAVSWQAVMALLRRRVGLLDGVVFSGGEPTLQRGLAAAMREVRGLGLRVGLHTAGPYPDRLSAVLQLTDWVGFDVKARFEDYPRLTGVPGSGARARASLLRLLASGVACEVRTTVDPALLDTAALHSLAETLAGLGVTRYALQACHGGAAAALPEALAARFAQLTIRA